MIPMIEVTTASGDVLIGVAHIISVSSSNDRVYITVDARSPEGETETYALDDTSYASVRYQIDMAIVHGGIY